MENILIGNEPVSGCGTSHTLINDDWRFILNMVQEHLAKHKQDGGGDFYIDLSDNKHIKDYSWNQQLVWSVFERTGPDSQEYCDELGDIIHDIQLYPDIIYHYLETEVLETHQEYDSTGRVICDDSNDVVMDVLMKLIDFERFLRNCGGFKMYPI